MRNGQNEDYLLWKGKRLLSSPSPRQNQEKQNEVKQYNLALEETNLERILGECPGSSLNEKIYRTTAKDPKKH